MKRPNQAMQRFSVKVFLLVTILHIFGTILLIDAGFAELQALKRAMQTGQSEVSFLWLTVWAWIWQPIEMLVSYYLRHHPRPVNPNGPMTGLGPSDYFFYFMLPWSVFVGICFGLLVPRLSQWRRRTA
jgi:hypothetical protein